MIGYIRGEVVAKDESFAVLDVNGIGYEVQMPKTAIAMLPAIGEEARVFTHLVISDSAMSLYGFLDADGLHLFKVLLEVSGVGPRLALNILSALAPKELLQDIANGQHTRLRSVHGVGKKTAARICVDLKDKARKMLETWEQAVTGSPLAGAPSSVGDGANSVEGDAVSALVNLGYKPFEARRAVRQALSDDKGISLDNLIRKALNLLSKV